ncbi:MAG: thiamine pyrophosphate-binding protein, partial [Cyanobacteriota bacterium]|nr:thiamine pyrophosphate-binding protein [Cyanobacteriota bacterium]
PTLPMPSATVAQYTLSRLAQLGIDRVFGVPGDYAFSIDDAAEQVPGLAWVACTNELNAAYAADGYARIRGAAILSTTYGVGELSALNGVMGSLAHRLPVFHLVGQPSERIQRLGLITHHNLGDTLYNRFQAISAAAACVSAVLTPDNCIDELERVIREALRQSRPAYLVISELSGAQPVLGTPVSGQPLSALKRQRSVPRELEAAAQTILHRLESARQPVALLTQLVSRYGLRDTALAFIAKTNLPTAVTPNDKGTMEEAMPQAIGLYAGQFSSSEAVRQRVDSADLVLDIGGVVSSELNTGFWSTQLDPARTIAIHDTWVRAGDKVFANVAIDDLLPALLERVTVRCADHGLRLEPAALVGGPNDPTTSANLYPRLWQRLRAGDTLVIETGTCMTHLNKLPLPAGVSAEAQGLWGSIGWATPACLGIALAKSSGHTWLVTGDGAHQMSLNELAVMGRYGIQPRIVVLNNRLYGIEDVLSERGHGYDDLAPVQYHLLPQALGCANWLSARVSTVAALDQVLDQLEAHPGAAYIEVMIPNEESQPLPQSLIDNAYKLQTPAAG